MCYERNTQINDKVAVILILYFTVFVMDIGWTSAVPPLRNEATSLACTFPITHK
jgi:hypothetical protein